MDNAIVITAGVFGLLVSQLTNGVVENVTALSIVGFVVYYCLDKFDKQLKNIESMTVDIHKEIHKKKEE